MKDKMWCDLENDSEKAEFLKAGRGSATGIVAPSIEQDIARVYALSAKIGKPKAKRAE